MMKQTKNAIGSLNTPSAGISSRRAASMVLVLAAIVITTTLTVRVSRAESPNDILVIVNSSVKVSSLTSEDVKEIFLKKRRSFSSGERAVPINAGDNAKLREEFRERVLKMSATDERTYWQTLKIKEGEVDPAVFSNNLKAVFKLRGGVSYIYRSQYKANVAKVVLVLSGR